MTPTPREYFCNGCGHLRLCLDDAQVTCGNCKGTDLIWGRVNELDKDKLKAEYAKQHAS